MSNGPLASSKINSEKKKGNNSEKNFYFQNVWTFILQGHYCGHMLDAIFLTLIVFSQLMSQIYNDYIENTQKGA